MISVRRPKSRISEQKKSMELLRIETSLKPNTKEKANHLLRCKKVILSQLNSYSNASTLISTDGIVWVDHSIKSLVVYLQWQLASTISLVILVRPQIKEGQSWPRRHHLKFLALNNLSMKSDSVLFLEIAQSWNGSIFFASISESKDLVEYSISQKVQRTSRKSLPLKLLLKLSKLDCKTRTRLTFIIATITTCVL